MKYCQKCQLERSEEFEFCSNCGSRLLATCPLPELADNSPREVLRYLVQKHPECVKSLSLLKWLLSVYLANARTERVLLYAAAENIIPELLQKVDRLNAPLCGSLSEILTTQCFMQPEMAREGVLIWAYALGKEVEVVLPPSPTSQETSASSLKTQSKPLPKPKQQTKSALSVSVPQVGRTLTLALPNGVAMELVWCPPGSFVMGSHKYELGKYSDETSQHQVTLTKGFWIGKYAVTQEQYEAVMGSNPSLFKGARHPVERVSWDEAMAFCSRVQLPRDGRIPSGYKLTLPTEAQWECACRAGTASALNNGLELTSDIGECENLAQVGWYGKNSNGETHEVGQKSPNAWGLYDMHGNVWEWCIERFGGRSKTTTDPICPGAGSRSFRIVRGGSWRCCAWECRSATLEGVHCRSDYRIDLGILGFRSALSPFNSDGYQLIPQIGEVF